MLTRYTYDIFNKGPLDGYTTCHSERMHQKSAKQPFKQTNGHSRTFTRSMANIIEDKDAFFDLYNTTLFSNPPVPPHFALQPLNLSESVSSNQKNAAYCLQSVTRHTTFNDIKLAFPHINQLKSVIRLYLNTILESNSNRIKVKNTPNLLDTVMVFKEMKRTEFDEDGLEELNCIREKETMPAAL